MFLAFDLLLVLNFESDVVALDFREQEQASVIEKEVQDHKEGERTSQEEGKGSKEARHAKEEGGEGSWYPQ